jgi:hypothetical protein
MSTEDPGWTDDKQAFRWPTRYGFTITLSGQALWLVSTCGQCWYNNSGRCPMHGSVRRVWDQRPACWKYVENAELEPEASDGAAR